MAERLHVGGLDVILEQDSDGWFVATVPALAGCHTQARTKAELRDRIAEAIDLCRETEPPARPLGFQPNR
ncbi:MAG: type II toxin-antitoxin system HicB family antitoxin [Thermoanaerobaculia bacterium]|nr:type II toxin-antitoxin system HicB family antitoxin [Thermoanaerobaculia bacterium]